MDNNNDWIESQNNEVKRWRSMVARKLVSFRPGENSK